MKFQRLAMRYLEMEIAVNLTYLPFLVVPWRPQPLLFSHKLIDTWYHTWLCSDIYSQDIDLPTA